MLFSGDCRQQGPPTVTCSDFISLDRCKARRCTRHLSRVYRCYGSDSSRVICSLLRPRNSSVASYRPRQYPGRTSSVRQSISGSGEGQHTRARWSLALCQAADVSVHTMPKVPGAQACDLPAWRSCRTQQIKQARPRRCLTPAETCPYRTSFGALTDSRRPAPAYGLTPSRPCPGHTVSPDARSISALAGYPPGTRRLPVKRPT